MARLFVLRAHDLNVISLLSECSLSSSLRQERVTVGSGPTRLKCGWQNHRVSGPISLAIFGESALRHQRSPSGAEQRARLISRQMYEVLQLAGAVIQSTHPSHLMSTLSRNERLQTTWRESWILALDKVKLAVTLGHGFDEIRTVRRS